MNTVSEADHPSLQSAQVVAQRLGVDPMHGLSSAEARLRLERDGPNELLAETPPPAWRHLLSQFQDPLVYLLLIGLPLNLQGTSWWNGVKGQLFKRKSA